MTLGQDLHKTWAYNSLQHPSKKASISLQSDQQFSYFTSNIESYFLGSLDKRSKVSVKITVPDLIIPNFCLISGKAALFVYSSGNCLCVKSFAVSWLHNAGHLQHLLVACFSRSFPLFEADYSSSLTEIYKPRNSGTP